ncbi:hypothetical protein BJF78_17845 [Pseudonocardia sp. CNS-139]|nr:hypothetical protein BJF78_17845 [Pseudonocardia sp. CNS-139]
MQDLVDIVWEGARTGTFDSTPLEGRWTLDQGEQAQLAVLARWVEQGRTRAGWKVGLTSGAVRDSFGEGVRPFGFILRERVFESGATVGLGQMSRPGLEMELCFRIAPGWPAPASTRTTRHARSRGSRPRSS